MMIHYKSTASPFHCMWSVRSNCNFCVWSWQRNIYYHSTSRKCLFYQQQLRNRPLFCLRLTIQHFHIAQFVPPKGDLNWLDDTWYAQLHHNQFIAKEMKNSLRKLGPFWLNQQSFHTQDTILNILCNIRCELSVGYDCLLVIFVTRCDPVILSYHLTHFLEYGLTQLCQ